jgi:hypothetical protein
MPTGMRIVKARLMRFQIGMRIQVTFWQRIYLLLSMPRDFE